MQLTGETVSREISTLKGDDLIQVRSQGIFIKSIGALEKALEKEL